MRRTILAACVAAFSFAAITVAAEERVIELPLSGPAYRLANEAYEAFARADYALAADKAREAIRLRPDVVRLRELLDKSLRAQRGSSPVQEASPGHAAAAQAYAALTGKRFDAAIASAAEAVRRDPRKAEYRLLLAQAYSAGGHPTDAARILSTAIDKLGDRDGKLSSRLAVIRLSQAATPMQAYYRAVASDDHASALAAIREVVALVPDVPAYRLILVRTLVENRRLDEAEEQANLAVAAAPSDAVSITFRGAIHQLRGDAAAARADFDRALVLAESDPAAARAVRLIATDAAFSALDRARALALLAPLRDSTDEAVRERVRNAERLPATYRAAPELAFAFPELDCRTAAYGQICGLVPGVPPNLAYAAAHVAYQALAGRQFRRAAESSRLAHHMAPDNRAYGLLFARSLLGAGDAAEAERIATEELARYPGDADLLMMRAEARQRQSANARARADFDAALRTGTLTVRDEIVALVGLGRVSEARQRFHTARDQGELAKLSDVELAYLANHVGSHDVALSFFRDADDKATLPDSVLLDTAYTAMQADRPSDARTYFMRAIDAAADGKLAIEPVNLLAARRDVAQLERTWGIFGGVTYGSTVAMAGTPSATLLNANRVDNDALQAGAEVYWRPFGYQREGQVELFGRAFETLHNKADEAVNGAPTAQASIGARVKPVATQNLFFMVSKLIPVGSLAQSNWLAQMSYFNGTGLDMRFDTDSWITAQLSAEVGRYFHRARNYALLSMQWGRSYRVDRSIVVTPHVVVAGEYDTALDKDPARQEQRRAIGVGPGVTFRYWFHESKYAAEHSYVDFTLQYRHKVSGDDRATGPYVGLSFAY